jgi:hypothetical protein
VTARIEITLLILLPNLHANEGGSLALAASAECVLPKETGDASDSKLHTVGTELSQNHASLSPSVLSIWQQVYPHINHHLATYLTPTEISVCSKQAMDLLELVVDTREDANHGSGTL